MYLYVSVKSVTIVNANLINIMFDITGNFHLWQQFCTYEYIP